MTTNEQIFIEKWNEMLKAAKEMEKEGNIITDFGFKLGSNNTYSLERQEVVHRMKGCFIENKFKLKEE